MHLTASFPQNHYLDTYNQHYSFRDIEFDQQHVEHLLTNFLHLQDLINRNVQDLAYLMGTMLRLKPQPQAKQPKTNDDEDKLCFQLKNTSNLSQLLRKEKSKAEKYVRNNRYKVMKEESNGSKPKAFRMQSQDSKRSLDSKMRIESQDSAKRDNLVVIAYNGNTNIGIDDQKFIEPGRDENSQQEHNEPEYQPNIQEKIANFTNFLHSADKLIVQKIEKANINADCFKETKRALYAREPVRIIHRKKADRQMLNGFECFECKQVI